VSEAFRGEFYQKVDGKARVSIPAVFRRILESEDAASSRTRIIMVYGGKSRNFVECYTKAGADALARDIEAMPQGEKARLRAERELITQSVVTEIDEDGRIVLPQRVREKMGFAADDMAQGGEAAFAGATNRFKLYRRDVYDAELAQDDEDDDGSDVLALVSKHKSAV
jgi:MraZ protein